MFPLRSLFFIFLGAFSLTPVILVNPAEAGDHFACPCFGEKAVQALFKFFGTFACRINIGNADAFVALGKRLIVFPRKRIVPNGVQDILRRKPVLKILIGLGFFVVTLLICFLIASAMLSLL